MKTPVICLEQVSVFRGETVILSDVSLRLGRGEHCVVLGPNGAGKTTLVQVISGYLWPSEGRVSVLGQLFGQTDLHRLRRHVGLVSQANVEKFSPLMRGRDVIYTGYQGTLALREVPSAAVRSAAEQLVEQFALSKVIDKRFGLLSAGERQRVVIARALMDDPALLILDEPAAGMDMAGREKLLIHIEQLASRQDSPTLLMVTHHISEIMPTFTKAVLLKSGSIVAYGPKDSTLSEQNLSQLYGMQVKLHTESGRLWPRVYAAD